VTIELRAATTADLDAIDTIEQHSFSRPWPRATFEAELTREWAHVDVLVLDGKIVAFCDYWVVPPPRAQRGEENDNFAGGEMQILVIATSPDHRGRGLGGQMLAHVLARSAEAGCQVASLEVRAGNAPAIALYERHGFRTVHVRARYYQDDDEDALVMTRGLSTG
jgi:[ribosomal protein S18]-alanine N-acetyltransferase